MALSLEHALGQLKLSAAGFERIDAAGPWRPGPPAAGQVHIFAVLSGSGELATGTAGAVTIAPGQLHLAGADHEFCFVPGRAGLALAHGMVAATLLNGRCVFDFITLPCSVDLAGTELFNGAIPELLRESQHTDAGAAAVVNCLVRRVVTVVLRKAWPEGEALPLADSGSHVQQLQKIVDAMAKDPARTFTLDSLAQEAGMSRTAFHKAFNKAYGKSPLAMLRSMRLQKAQDLLIYTDLPIKAIAARLGYSSRSYFWQTFKNALGMDPASYRTQKN